MENMEKPPFKWMAIVGLLVLFALILIVSSLIKGCSAFIEDGGASWIIVISILFLVVFLIYRAKGSK